MTSVHICHLHLFPTLSRIDFKPTCFDPNVWIKGREGGYKYTRTQTGDVLVMYEYLNYISEKLKKIYTIKALSSPKVHIDCDYMRVNMESTTWWVMGSLNYYD